ncbi:hypothetical protein BD410DRAFT_728922, partial [Rickenella mellea]
QPGKSYDDPSDQLWSLYVSKAEKFDRALVESWKGDMDGILIFAGLFSASVTAFIMESYKKLSPDSGDATVTARGDFEWHKPWSLGSTSCPASLSSNIVRSQC